MVYRHLLLPPTSAEIPLNRKAQTRHELPLSHPMRARRSQIIYPAILRVCWSVYKEAYDVLYSEAVICLSPEDLFRLDTPIDYETLRQHVWNRWNALHNIQMSSNLPRCFIDSLVFRRFEKIHIELDYWQFGWQANPPREQYPIYLRELELEANHHSPRLINPAVRTLLRSDNAFIVILRVIRELPLIKSLSIDVSVMIRNFIPYLLYLDKNGNTLERSLMRLSLTGLVTAFDAFYHLGKLSNVKEFDLQMYAWVGRINGIPWDTNAPVFKLPQIGAEIKQLKARVEGISNWRPRIREQEA